MDAQTEQRQPAGEKPVRRRRGRPKAGSDKRVRRVITRFSEREYAALDAAAQAAGGFSVGAYCAAVTRAVAATEAGRRPALTETVLGELVAARRQLVRVGGNLNQIAAAANAGGAVDPAQAAAVYQAVAAAVARVEDTAASIAAGGGAR